MNNKISKKKKKYVAYFSVHYTDYRYWATKTGHQDHQEDEQKNTQKMFHSKKPIT